MAVEVLIVSLLDAKQTLDIWASTRENLSLGFPTKSAGMRRLVLAFVVRKQPKTGFLASRPR